MPTADPIDSFACFPKFWNLVQSSGNENTDFRIVFQVCFNEKIKALK